MSITYTFVGHATHTFDISGKTVIVDPSFACCPQAIRWNSDRS